MTKKSKLSKETGISILKGLIGTIPYAGTALNEILFENRSRIKQRRVNSFIENFSKYLKQFNKEELKLEQITNEDFGDFFEEIILKVSKTRSQIKVEKIKNLLTNQLIKPIDINYAELFLDILSSLQEKQIPILLKLYDSFDSIYTSSKGELVQKEDELQITRKELKKEEWNLNSEEDAIFVNEISILREKIKKLKSEIKKLNKIIQENEEPYLPKTYNCEGYEFYYLIQDLVGKGLLVDLGMRYRAEPLELFEITQLGIDMIDSLKENKANS